MLDRIRAGKNLPVPDYWRGTVDDVDEVLDQVTRGRVISLRTSAGGRLLRRRLRLTSAFETNGQFELGLRGLSTAYVDKTDRRPSLMLVGGAPRF